MLVPSDRKRSIAKAAGDRTTGLSFAPTFPTVQACTRGTRVVVHQIVRMLANGDTIEGLPEAYPSIAREDVAACLYYAASLAEERVAPIDEVPFGA